MVITEYKPAFFTGYEKKSFRVNTKEELLNCSLCKDLTKDYTICFEKGPCESGSIIAVCNTKAEHWVVGKVYNQDDVDTLSQWFPDFYEVLRQRKL